MNRRERQDQKKRKREAKRRAAQTMRRPTRTGFASGAIPESGLLQKRIAAAFELETSNATIVDAAEIAAEVTDQAIDVAWRNSALVPECREGCSYCCHVRVDVTIPEVARAVEYARENLSPAELARISQRAQQNAALTHGTTNLMYPVRLPCAFLGDEGKCSVYAARPLMCRREHSLDSSQCKDGFETAQIGEDFPVDRDPGVSDFGLMAIESYRDATARAGVDSTSYELQEALHIALSKPAAIASWLEGSNEFESSRLNETVDEGEIPLRLVELRPRK